MKKVFISLLLVTSLVVSLVGCDSREVLRFYNWGEYIDEEIVTAFEAEYGVRVQTSFFTSNEIAITKMKSGEQYDLMIPSEYAVEQLMRENMLEQIDWSRVTTMQKTDLAEGMLKIIDDIKDDENGYDFLEYSVPYFWGNVGLLYNTDVVDEADLKTENWGVLANQKYKVSFYNTSREGFLVALKHLGYSMNSGVQSQVNEAKDWLINVKKEKAGKVSYVTDQVLTDMIDPNTMAYDMSVVYAGDAIYLMRENDKLDFYVPTNGTNVFVDGFVIPKNANTDLAYKFISFLSDYDNALANTLFVGYSTPRKDVLEDVTAAGGDYEDVKELYNFTVQDSDEIFRHNADAKKMLDEAWEAVKAA